MRKLIFIGFIAVGALIGWLSVMHGDWRTRPCDDGRWRTFYGAHWRGSGRHRKEEAIPCVE
jgi:hypothetical protein